MGTDTQRLRGASDGCYDAQRAAALSGVPKSTVYWWARHGIVVPSVSPVQEKLWSFSDLMALRIVSWLRHPKPDERDDGTLPASPMPKVRRALDLLDELGLDVWDPESPQSPLLVDRAGDIFVRTAYEVLTPDRQPTLLPVGALRLTEPFTASGLEGT